MAIRISIIIPCFNAQKTLAFLLDSLHGQLQEDDELIVVDDGSTDASASIAKTFGAKFVATEVRKGPAAARNLGAAKATGDLLLFLDADVITPKYLLAHVRARFAQEPDLQALSGVYDAEPANEGFFQRLKAVQTAVWFDGMDAYESLETACAAIRKDAFEKAGGFDETFTGADVEDYELGYRLGKSIEVDHRMAVRHHFPDFWANTKNYYRRAKQWALLYRKRKSFDSGSATSKFSAAITALPTLILALALFWIIAGCFVSGLLCCTLLIAWCVFKWPVIRELIFFTNSNKGLLGYPLLYIGDLAAMAGAVAGFLR